ncbi:MAG: MucR family transcriptional regulator [Hyphomonadaceae bacterium]|nr:MucR family transcriptional regulator [Hyphomonadaceae bacterium]
MRTDEEVKLTASEKTLRMTADIVASFVANNKVAPEQLVELIRSVHRTVESLSSGQEDRPSEKARPAVAVNKSVQDDFIVCLEDGKKLKMLKRYLRSTYNMSPEDYRRKWGLPADYPMVAPAYAARRSEFAKKIGLGRGVRRKD